MIEKFFQLHHQKGPDGQCKHILLMLLLLLELQLHCIKFLLYQLYHRRLCILEGGHEEVSSEVKAICAIYPPAKIRKIENTDPIIDAYRMLMGEVDQEEYDKASPLLQIKEDFPPTMLVHGSSDSVVRLEDSTDLYQKLKEENIPAELHIFSEEDHAFDSARGYGRSVAELQNLFFKKYL